MLGKSLISTISTRAGWSKTSQNISSVSNAVIIDSKLKATEATAATKHLKLRHAEMLGAQK